MVDFDLINKKGHTNKNNPTWYDVKPLRFSACLAPLAWSGLKDTIYMSFNYEAKIAARATLRPGQANGARPSQVL